MLQLLCSFRPRDPHGSNRAPTDAQGPSYALFRGAWDRENMEGYALASTCYAYTPVLARMLLTLRTGVPFRRPFPVRTLPASVPGPPLQLRKCWPTLRLVADLASA